MFGRELREVNLALDDAPAVAKAVVPGDLGVRDEPGGGLRRGSSESDADIRNSRCQSADR